MQECIALHTLITTSDEGFSLDEFILKLKEYANAEGLPSLVQFVLHLVDELLLLRQTSGPEASRLPCPHCGGRLFECKDRTSRRVRTGIGTVEFLWRRYGCQGCRKTVIPLRDFLHLKRWQSKTCELEKTAMEVFTEQSYRRGTDHFEKIGVIPLPHSTAHRWVMQTASGALSTPRDDVQVVMADGTGFKRRPDPVAGVDNQGEIRVAVGLTRQGTWVALRAESQEEWAQFAEGLKTVCGGGDNPPVMGVTDGGRGLPEAMAHVAGQVQRCTWHLVDQLRFALYEDRVMKPGQEPYLEDISTILSIQLPAGEFEEIRPEERAAVEQKLFESAEKMDQLIATLHTAGHVHAATYLKQSQSHAFSWLAFWLKTGLKCPRTTSYLERLMREIGRRLKKIAFGWKPAGAAQMTRLIIRKIVNPDEWETYWKTRLRLLDNIHILFRSVCTTTA